MNQIDSNLMNGVSERDEQSEFISRPRAENAVQTLLRFVNEDPDRDGLKDTPARVVRAWEEMTRGYSQKPDVILSRTFDETSDELIVLTGINFHSLCEHHLLGFAGTVSIGYLPGKVVGISKLARLVECFSRRFQIQERMTSQIASAIEEHLSPRGVAVVVKAHHSCMGCRGVMQPGALMSTSSMLGTMRESETARAEFLSMIR